MAAPVLAKIIAIKVAATTGETVLVRNNTRGGILTALVNSSGEAVINPATSLKWQDGDALFAEIRGSVTGFKAGTIQSGGAKLIISASADTSSPGVSL
ncbi:MAG: hypothetical protein CMH64_01745 [Nanoarchaeota archaeon]|jgi:hypothetical protein|nr:hypothetical protein [Nanoarchaeota archaeon]|tara:strand:+ start:367 stop:660 length:294 start_codon:yes stop_codon:yes gene_type:complete